MRRKIHGEPFQMYHFYADKYTVLTFTSMYFSTYSYIKPLTFIYAHVNNNYEKYDLRISNLCDFCNSISEEYNVDT